MFICLALMGAGSEPAVSQGEVLGEEAWNQLHSLPLNLGGHVPSCPNIQVGGGLCRAGPWDRILTSGAASPWCAPAESNWRSAIDQRRREREDERGWAGEMEHGWKVLCSLLSMMDIIGFSRTGLFWLWREIKYGMGSPIVKFLYEQE